MAMKLNIIEKIIQMFEKKGCPFSGQPSQQTLFNLLNYYELLNPWSSHPWYWIWIIIRYGWISVPPYLGKSFITTGYPLNQLQDVGLLVNPP